MEVLRYFVVVCAYALIGRGALAVVQDQFPRSTPAVGVLLVVWFAGFMWITAYLMAGKDHANYFLKFVAYVLGAKIAVAAVIVLLFSL